MEGNHPNKARLQTRRETHKKRSQLIVAAIATKAKAVVCTGVAGSAEGKAGAACQAALVSALCLRSPQWNFTIHALLDWAPCTPLTLNGYRQTTLHSRLCIVDWSMQYCPLSCSYSGCLWGITAYRLSIPHQERPHSQKDKHQNWTLFFSPPLWTLRTCPGGIHASQPVLLCAVILPGCCRKIIFTVPHAGELPRQTKLSGSTSLQ